MYRTYKLTNEEEGKIVRYRFDGDTSYYDVFETQEECDREEQRLAKIQREYEQMKTAYLETTKDVV